MGKEYDMQSPGTLPFTHEKKKAPKLFIILSSSNSLQNQLGSNEKHHISKDGIL
jgi:hypothetical protein